MYRDVLRRDLSIGDKVMYTTSSRNVDYNFGTIMRFEKDSYNLDCAVLNVVHTTDGFPIKKSKRKIYLTNIIKLPILDCEVDEIFEDS